MKQSLVLKFTGELATKQRFSAVVRQNFRRRTEYRVPSRLAQVCQGTLPVLNKQVEVYALSAGVGFKL